MKIKCKKCEKKFKNPDSKKLECEVSNCEIKYDMRGEIVHIDGLHLAKQPDIVAVFTSEEPAKITSPITGEMSEDEWQEYLKGSGFSDGSCPF